MHSFHAPPRPRDACLGPPPRLLGGRGRGPAGQTRAPQTRRAWAAAHRRRRRCGPEGTRHPAQEWALLGEAWRLDGFSSVTAAMLLGGLGGRVVAFIALPFSGARRGRDLQRPCPAPCGH
eukprot:scaffold13017_cov92-Isochrysis_galbana.AAC.2